MEYQTIRRFLNEITDLRGKISSKRHESALRGEDFNVFNVLGLWSEEVRLHSAMLAELLNPAGSHGCGDEFLKAFYCVVGICPGDNDVNMGKAVVSVERYIGPIDEGYENGGRIDIMVETPKESGLPSLIIENKIYAQDQYNQLRRYYNYASREPSDFRIVYLTLDGSTPSETSIGEGPQFDYEVISYSRHIAEWLRACASIAFDKPKVRETVIQYLHLINQIVSNNMNQPNEIVDQIASDNSMMVSALLVCSYKNELSKQAITKIISPYLQNLAETMTHELEQYDVVYEPAEDFDYKGDKIDWSFSFMITNKQSHKKICLRFVFENWGLINLHYGIDNRNTSRDVAQQNIFGNTSESWPWGWRWFEDYQDWTGDKLAQIIEEITRKDPSSRFVSTITTAIAESAKACQ